MLGSILSHNNDTFNSIGSEYDIDVARLMPSLCVDITLLLTFGLASPLFSIVVACSIIVNALMWRLALGRYIIIVSKAASINVCYEKLETAFGDEWRCLPRSWWMMSGFIGLFWSLFVNDMIGDKNPAGGIVAAMLMMIWCLSVFFSLKWLLSIDPDTDTDTDATAAASDTGVTLHRIREYTSGLASRVHEIVWKNVLRLDDSSSDTSDANCRTSSISSLGSVDTTTRVRDRANIIK